MNNELELKPAAIAAVTRGWPVFPVAAGQKVPMKGSSGFKDATIDRDQVEAWWTKSPDANLGIATGTPSGFFALDVDPRHDGEETMHALVAEHGRLPATVTVETPGGGVHAYFQMPDFDLANSAGRIGAGVDIRANGGYVVGVGSAVAGRAYRYREGRSPDDVGIAPAPDWLLDLLRAPARNAAPGNALDDATIPEGQRNTTLASFAGSMRNRGMSPGAIRAALLAENRQRCDPPMSDLEVERIAANIAKYEPGVAEQRNDAGRADGGGSELTAISAPELLATEVPSVDWLVEGVLPVGAVGVLAGPSGSGKTWFALELGLAVAAGRAFLGQFETVQGTVLVIDKENILRLLQQRVGALTESPPAELHYVIGSDLRIDRPADLDRLERLIRELRPALLVIDSGVRFSIADENSANEMARISDVWMGIRNRHSCALLILDHTRKAPGPFADRVRGSVEKQAFADLILGVEPIEKKPMRSKIEQLKSRFDEPIDPFEVDLVHRADGRLELVHAGAPRSVAEVDATGAVREALTEAQGPVTKPELRQVIGEVSLKQLDRVLGQLQRDGLVIGSPRQTGGRGRPPTEYELSPIAEVRAGLADPIDQSTGNKVTMDSARAQLPVDDGDGLDAGDALPPVDNEIDLQGVREQFPEVDQPGLAPGAALPAVEAEVSLDAARDQLPPADNSEDVLG